MTQSECYDFVVVGGGIAGASIAARLSSKATVQLVEMESQLGYHTTGRSAALFIEAYGNETVRALTRASRQFFYTPPDGFCATPLVSPRSILVVGREGQEDDLAAFVEAEAPYQVRRISADEAVSLHPLLKHDGLIGGAITDRAADIDVHALHHGFLRILKQRSGVVATSAAVINIERDRDEWRLDTLTDTFRAKVVVNAAGAWASEIGKLAGAQDIGLRPLRRTAILVDPPSGMVPEGWPLLSDVGDQFYVKPDAGKLLLSPSDATLSVPCDAQPEELDIALAVERIEQATLLRVRRISHKWAGLRSFVQDQSPVVGYDGTVPNFFWLAALGGFGIQTAPALSEIAASLALHRPIPATISELGINPADFDPGRLTSIVPGVSSGAV